MEKSDIKNQLGQNICEVVFTKVNGDERVMKCTLISEYITTVAKTQQELTKQENPNTIAVWDLDNNAWRSFRVDSVKSIKAYETHIR